MRIVAKITPKSVRVKVVNKAIASSKSLFNAVKQKLGGVAVPKSVDDILKPNGDFIGAVNKGATPNIRTASSSEFNTLKDDLLDGATASGTYAGGKGTRYDLPNGGRVGV